MNRDLFLAILALDSYNRGYDVRLSGLSDDAGVRLGQATVLTNSDSLVDDEGNQTAEPAGFYAIAYEWNGETIISYRGTDKFGQDAVNGYAIGGGFTGLIAPQGLRDSINKLSREAVIND